MKQATLFNLEYAHEYAKRCAEHLAQARESGGLDLDLLIKTSAFLLDAVEFRIGMLQMSTVIQSPTGQAALKGMESDAE